MTLKPSETRPGCAARYHDTYSAYMKAGCKCLKAREDNRLYHKRRRECRDQPRLVDPTGPRRMLRGLMVMGWPSATIGEQMGGRSDQTIMQLAYGRNTVMQRNTADRIRAVYADLLSKPGPSTQASQRALARGWVSPLAWENIEDPDEFASYSAPPPPGPPDPDRLEPLIIERALAWRRPVMSTTEFRTAVLRANDVLRMNAVDIADMLGVDVGDVRKVREARLRANRKARKRGLAVAS